ncbi:MAG: hypothetical protein WCL71_07005 [Deltaproteobacteria bacterium]
MLHSALILISAMITAGAERPAPQIDITEALSIAVSSIRDRKPFDGLPTPRFPISANLVDDSDWGLMWVIVFDTVPPVKTFDDEYSRQITPWAYETHVNMQSQVNSQFVAFFRQGWANNLPTGTPVPGKKGFCITPHCGLGHYTDVRLFRSGAIIRCIDTGRPFIIPDTNIKK